MQRIIQPVTKNNYIYPSFIHFTKKNNMTLRFLLLLTTLFSLNLLKAQDMEVQWGLQTKDGGSSTSYIPLGWNAGHYYVVQIDGNDGYLLNIDSKMNLESQTELITGSKKFEADIIFMRDNKIHLLYSDYESGEKTTYVRATTFSLKGKAEGTKLKKVAGITVEKSTQKNDVKYFYSSDSSKLLIVEELDMKKTDDAQISLTVVNTTTFETDWSTMSTIPYESGYFFPLSYAVEKNGNVMMLATIKGSEGKNMERYSTHMFSFAGKTEKFQQKELALDGKFISSAAIRFVDNEKILITGFYNDLTTKGKDEGIEGSFLAIADPVDLGSLDLHVKPMDIFTKTSIVRTGNLSQFFDADELNAYSMREINVNPDGSGYVIAEQRFMVQNDNGNLMTRTYYFNHLILYRFDENQEITWISTIPKVQVSSISTPIIGIGPISFWFFTGGMIRSAYKYNSFLSMEKDGNIYVLYNDHKDNGDAKTLKEVKPMTNKNKALATVAIVGQDGKWEKTQLFRGKDLDVILETSSSFPINNIGFTISAEKGKSLQYGKLDL